MFSVSRAIAPPAIDDPAQPTPDPEPPLNGTLRGVLTAIVVMSAAVFYFFATHGTWSPTLELAGTDSGFFAAQARAIVHGHLNVSYQLLGGECYVHGGRCYGYYGLTPSILRLPFLLLLDATHSSLSAVYSTVALTLALAASLATLHRLMRGRTTHRVTIGAALVALALGPASVLVQLTRTSMFEEAIAWSIAFSCLGLYALLRWWQELPPKWLGLAVVCFILSANSRPTGLVTAVVAGVGVGLRLLAARHRGVPDLRRNWQIAAGLLVLPVVTTIGVFELKFGAPTPNLLSDPAVLQE